MKIFNINDNIDNVPKLKKPINLCLGYFDGVHIAHQRLINESMSNSNHQVGVITFADNVKSRAYLTSLEGRINLFKSLKVDYVFIFPFNDKIKNTTHVLFNEKFFDKLNIHTLYMGKDFTFGKDGLGNVNYLKKYHHVKVLPDIKKDNQKISSKTITNLIKAGEIKKANACLGRPYEIKGKVVTGYRHGGDLNFPTANINFKYDYVIPRFGVYKVIVYVLGVPHLGIANVGVHPTVNKLKKPIIEVHIPCFSGNLYHQEVYIEFVDFLRPEKKFNSEKALVKQINLDLKALNK